jgi:hypothetical protein
MKLSNKVARAEPCFTLSTAPASFRSASNFEVAAQPRDVALRRGSELFFVVAAEVRWILVADFEAGAGGVEVSSEHQAAGFLQNGKKMKTSIGVYYQDEYVREDNRGLIAKRKSVFDWEDKQELGR